MSQNTPPSLPRPDEAGHSHSERVAAHIRERIEAAGGRIGFAEFMHHALYAPGLGYYVAGAAKFGQAGDFITAPEVSGVFGAVVARQCAETIGELGYGGILEIGAGSGKLAADMLEAFESLGALPEVYQILEVSADLRERQRDLLTERIPHLVDRVEWLSGMPESHRGVIVANELLDALPVERFVRRDDGIARQCVRIADGGFTWDEEPAGDNLTRAVTSIEMDLGRVLPDGFTSEVSLASTNWVSDVAASLEEGLVLLFDYGVTRREYYAEDRAEGWLRCHYRHHAHNDPFVLAGIQDITSWVDFTGVAESADAAGLDVAGFSAQAQFLIAGGLDAAMADFENLSLEHQLELSQQVKTLTLPGEMGENFKCLALRRGDMPAPSGFALADRTHTL
ncbi:MAG: SAM-dependent methyltransferase [Woeseiaceae bacterium]|nr:SAM-dependent methyltransferase [Woeseiaceae bacterium]